MSGREEETGWSERQAVRTTQVLNLGGCTDGEDDGTYGEVPAPLSPAAEVQDFRLSRGVVLPGNRRDAECQEKTKNQHPETSHVCHVATSDVFLHVQACLYLRAIESTSLSRPSACL